MADRIAELEQSIKDIEEDLATRQDPQYTKMCQETIKELEFRLSHLRQGREPTVAEWVAFGKSIGVTYVIESIR